MFVNFWRDERGIILPYAALMIIAFVGLAGLGIDAGRQMSLQTQMQAAADALALAGARELNFGSNARDRAESAIANLVSNGVTGLGFSGSITATTNYYTTLNAATSGIGGTAANVTGSDAKFVSVTVAPGSIPRSFPVPGLGSTVNSGATAVAGFHGTAACNISPMFICNPYEASGMTDTQATNALHTALDENAPGFSALTLQRLLRMDASKTTPGHFGWVQPPNTTCNNTNCLSEWISRDTKVSLSQACYDQGGVTMATGNKPLEKAFNDRFDMYDVNLGPSTSYSPAINVRKGYVQTGGNACTIDRGDYLTAQMIKNDGAVSLAPAQTNITADVSKNDRTIPVTAITGIVKGMTVVVGSGATAAVVATVDGIPTGTNVPTSKVSQNIPNNTSLTFVWLAAGLPLDKAWNGICADGTCLQGNGSWDCESYWKINHSNAAGNLVAAAPDGCSANATTSRYKVYKYENTLASNQSTAAPIIDYSGYPRSTVANGENGAPLCAKSKGFTPTFDAEFDQRIAYVTMINCGAQTDNIGTGNNGEKVPAAGFAKLFLVQPYNGDGQGYLYGEMVELVNSLSASKIFYQVQLYR